jgi:hypothetical protein
LINQLNFVNFGRNWFVDEITSTTKRNDESQSVNSLDPIARAFTGAA